MKNNFSKVKKKNNIEKIGLHFCISISLISSLMEDSWILISASARNLLQYVFWLKYVEEIWPYIRY